MVEIISKSSGPRPQDAEFRRLIEQNRPVITKLADHLSGGSYSAGKAPKAEPRAKGLIIHTGGPARPAQVEPSIRISLNGRVVAVDENSGRQLHHIGDVRHLDGAEAFVLATKANGYFAPVDEPIATLLSDLDGCLVPAEGGEETLIGAINQRLGMD